jgi:hypothetical protein
MRFTPAFVSFAAIVAAHGDHDHDQEPLTGPHEGLWYNTLPGDGGKQVCFPVAICSFVAAIDLSTGRFDLLGDLHFRSPPLLSMSLEQRPVRCCIYRYGQVACLSNRCLTGEQALRLTLEHHTVLGRGSDPAVSDKVLVALIYSTSPSSSCMLT